MSNDAFGSPRHYPVQCPDCGTLAGYPRLVQTIREKPGHIRIDLACHACKGQWFQEIQIDPR